MCSEILIIKVRKMQGDTLKVVIGIGYGDFVSWCWGPMNLAYDNQTSCNTKSKFFGSYT